MTDLNISNITADKILLPLSASKNITASVLRLDKIHPVISGNKWFKLKYYLQQAQEQGKKTIVTFGGAWSNHIVATAAACKMNGLHAIGIIRGDEIEKFSPTLTASKDLGMQLVFISREAYRDKKIPLDINTPDYFLINEGGYGIKGAEGASAILNYCNKEFYSHTCCAVGTGTMMAGLINNAAPLQEVIGISVLKNNVEAATSITSLLKNKQTSFDLIHDYHFGGYAKYTAELIDFMNEFYRHTTIPSDFVYTAKLFYAVTDLLKNDFFIPGSRLLLIHSGGLQGNTSLKEGTLIF